MRARAHSVCTFSLSRALRLSVLLSLRLDLLLLLALLLLVGRELGDARARRRLRLLVQLLELDVLASRCCSRLLYSS